MCCWIAFIEKTIVINCENLFENTIVLVEDDNGVITGGILGSVDKDFCRESCAYVIKMYVETEFRGLGTARALVEAFQDEAKKLMKGIWLNDGTR